jgi:UrcA family protein
MSRILGVSFAVFAALGSLAQAGSLDTIRQEVKLQYWSSELASETGARALLARIDHAAREACGGAPFFYSTYTIAPLAAQRDFAQCHNDAVARTVTALNAPVLTQVYASNGQQYLLRVAGR